MIINYTSSGVNKLKTSLNDDTRVVIYDHHMFIVQATGLSPEEAIVHAGYKVFIGINDNSALTVGDT
jgi:hypothetical protein